MDNRDITNAQRRADHATHALSRIRAQLADLHSVAWEPSNATDNDRVRGGAQDHSPRSGPDIAKHLWNLTEHELERAEDILVGLERKITGWFMVTAILEPTRGSLITREEHDRQLANQRTRANNGEYTPARLVDQPTHPGKKR